MLLGGEPRRDHRRAGPGVAGAARRPAGHRDAGAGARLGYDALAVSGSDLTVWRLGAGAWGKAQVIKVPITYGSSS